MQKSCEGCGDKPSYYTKKCIECGYRFAFSASELDLERNLDRLRSARVYKFVRLLGAGLSFGAVGAAILDYPTVAVAVVGLGAAIYVAGVAASWWNMD